MKTQTYTGELTQEQINSISGDKMKTAEELFKKLEYVAMAEYHPNLEVEQFKIKEQSIKLIKEFLTEHDKEIISKIDEMIKELPDYSYTLTAEEALTELKQYLEKK